VNEEILHGTGGLSATLAGSYRIERELGAGGMATVYLAHDLKHERQVAIKVLREDLSASLGAGRFLREIKIAAQLQHPNILPLLDSGSANGLLYFVMPYVAGHSLRERLAREGELPVHEAVQLITEVVDALAHAHEHGVVHRDIKPDNVMLSGRHALVTDFGVAKAISEATGRNTVTTLGVAVGTPTYMSPEQAAADPHVDHRSDIYSVGVVAYELLTGRPPFTGATPQQVLAAHVTEAPDSMLRRRSAIPLAVDQIIMRCLAKRPADRFQSAAELHAVLEPLRTPSPGTTPAETRPFSAARWKRPIWYAAGIVAIVAAGVVAFVARRHSAQLAIGVTHALTTDAGLYLDPALSPDGRFISYAAGPPSMMRIVVRQTDGERTIALAPDLPGNQRWPQWSPDGQRIAFAGADGIYVVPALGGTAQRVVSVPSQDPVGPSPTWSPDGRRLAYSSGTAINVVDLATRASSVIAPRDSLLKVGRSPEAFDLRWSPDGRWIAATIGNEEFAFSRVNLGNTNTASIGLFAVDGRRVLKLTPRPELFELSPVWLPDSRTLLFISDREGGRDVYSVAIGADGQTAGAATRLTTGLRAHSISLSADGRMLAYSSYSMSANIWSVPLTANGVASTSQATQLTNGTDVIEEVTPSPDHRNLLITSNRSGHSNLYLVPIQGGPATRVTTDTVDDFSPAWSKDGHEIAYYNIVDKVIYTIAATGGPPQPVTPSGWYNRPDWSPDGRTLVLAGSRPDPARELAIVRRAGTGWGTPIPLANTKGGGFPVWSPDGSLIAYQALLGADEESAGVAVIPPTGGAARILVRGGSSTGSPRPIRIIWSDDSKSLYYRAIDSTGLATIWSVPVAGGPPRLLVRADDPNRPTSARARFAVVNGRVYERVAHHESTLGIAQLTSR
jgi:eukaryotic-like serine/threonine-protein kinase